MSRKYPYRFPFAKYPAVRLALLFSLGIVLSKVTGGGIITWIGLLAVFTTVWGWTEYRFQSTLQATYTSWAVIFYLMAIICFGGFWHTVFDRQNAPPSAQLLSAYTWEPVEIKGVIENIKQTSTGKYQLDVEADTTILEDSLIWKEPYLVRAVFDPAKATLPATVKLGARIHFQATIYPLEPKTNPHEFDYKQYLRSIGIYSQVGINNIYDVQKNRARLSWNTIRQKTLALIEHNFTPHTVPIAKALLIGYKNELQRDEKIAFSRAGLSHIMAVSGLHVGFIIAPFWLLIPLLWSYRWGKYLGLSFLILFLIFYAGLTNFSASVTRASLTGGLLAYGRLFHKSRDSKNITAVAALIILLFNPNDIFDIGFQLSFAAVYIILLILPVLQRFIPARIRQRWYGIPIMVVIVSFIVQIGLYPMLSYYFGEFSLVGPLANAVIVPWLSLVVPLALALLLVSSFLPGIGLLLNMPNNWFLEFLQWFVKKTVSLEWSWIQTPVTGPLLFFIWITALFLIAASSFARLRWKLLITFLLVLCLHQAKTLYNNIKSPPLTITMLDVGQGDATFIQTPSGKNILIDTGRWTPSYNSARYVIIPHLKAEGVQKLDAVFLSHPHADHIGGVAELIKTMKIDTIYNSGFFYDSELYKSYLHLARQHNIAVQSLGAGTAVPIDPAMRFYTYGPSEANNLSDPNEHSLVIELVYGQTEFLFTGDAGAAQEKILLQNYGNMMDTDFLKVGHHGSRTSSSEQLLAMATPRISGVSLALTNRYRHPHREALQRLSRSNTVLYFTSLRGALRFESNGNQIIPAPWQ